jgi:hypothetical protein
VKTAGQIQHGILTNRINIDQRIKEMLRLIIGLRCLINEHKKI